ncbi:hypothetical protein FM121_02865 [Vagococcus fluvialis bH819]|uniref:Uncharacterized protein n=1 Tax=Vagococcus fluvialis bH819 TaxID=1255619 RepID=A0A1X6WL73_9ENTE|nr:hypothetical protein FM121_02865 [Vagococcus fluvialis bH819]
MKSWKGRFDEIKQKNEKADDCSSGVTSCTPDMSAFIRE